MAPSILAVILRSVSFESVVEPEREPPAFFPVTVLSVLNKVLDATVWRLAFLADGDNEHGNE